MARSPRAIITPADGLRIGVHSPIEHQARQALAAGAEQILIRCDQPALIAGNVFRQDSVVEARIHPDGLGLLVSTRDPDRFYDLLNRIVLEHRIAIETVAPADENIHAVYQYLVGSNGVTTQ